MPLLNYTTQISTAKTIGEIQKELSQHGAEHIAISYHDGDVTALTFSIQVPMEQRKGSLSFQLPANVEAVFRILDQNSRIPTRLKTMEQARRVAWRILFVWVKAQMALLETEMVKAEQIFLGYLVNPVTGQSFFGQLEQTGFQKLLEPSKKSKA